MNTKNGTGNDGKWWGFGSREAYVKECIRKAKEIEEEVALFLRTFFPSHYGDAAVIEGYCPDGDIRCEKMGILLEVKNDTTSHKTGNYFIEEECYSKTKSEVWVFVDNDHYFFIRKPNLDALIETGNLERRDGGDNKAYSGWLLPRWKLRGECRSYPRKWKGDEEWYRKYVLRTDDNEGAAKKAAENKAEHNEGTGRPCSENSECTGQEVRTVRTDTEAASGAYLQPTAQVNPVGLG